MFFPQLNNSDKHYFTLLTLLLVVSLSFGDALSADDNKMFSEEFIELSLTRLEVIAQKKQINSLSGEALIKLIKTIESDEKLTGLKKEFLLMQSVIRLRLLLEEAGARPPEDNKLISAQRAVYLEQLQLLSELKSITRRQLSDGNHFQIVKAFPFDKAATSSIKWILDSEKSNQLWRIMKDFNYDLIEALLPKEKNEQVELLKRAITKLESSKHRSLLIWARGGDHGEAKLPAETILLLALNEGDLSMAAEALVLDNDITLHHYFSKIAEDYDTDQRFEFFKMISKMANHASVAMYQIEQLAIDDELKTDFFVSSLADSNSGSSAAHILSRNLSTDQIDDLAQVIETSQHGLEQKNALLALLLSDKTLAKQKISNLYQANKMAPKLAREVAPWFK